MYKTMKNKQTKQSVTKTQNNLDVRILKYTTAKYLSGVIKVHAHI